MDNEKRVVDTYEVIHAIPIGDKEVLLCEDKSAEHRYMCCYFESNGLVSHAFDGQGGNSRGKPTRFHEAGEMFHTVLS